MLNKLNKREEAAFVQAVVEGLGDVTPEEVKACLEGDYSSRKYTQVLDSLIVWHCAMRFALEV